jgi:hypothetical protein
MSETKQAAFEGWAIVELFGHAKEIGFVTTQYFGSACLFQIDVPPLPEREIILDRVQYIQHDNEGGIHWTPAGSKVKRLASPGRSPLVGPSAIYKLTPCTQETAMLALEEFCPRPMVLLELAKKQDAPQVEWPEDGFGAEALSDRL